MHEFIVCAFLIRVGTTLKHVLKFLVHVMLSCYYIFFSNNNINYLLIICYAENHILIAVLNCTHGGRLKDESKRFHFRDKLENIKQHLFGPNNGARIIQIATAFETVSDYSSHNPKLQI